MNNIIKAYKSLSDEEKYYVKELALNLTSFPLELSMSYSLYMSEINNSQNPRIAIIYMVATIFSAFMIDKNVYALSKGRKI